MDADERRYLGSLRDRITPACNEGSRCHDQRSPHLPLRLSALICGQRCSTETKDIASPLKKALAHGLMRPLTRTPPCAHLPQATVRSPLGSRPPPPRPRHERSPSPQSAPQLQRPTGPTTRPLRFPLSPARRAEAQRRRRERVPLSPVSGSSVTSGVRADRKHSLAFPGRSGVSECHCSSPSF